MKVKQSNLEKSLDILREVEKKLKKSIQSQSGIKLQINDIKYQSNCKNKSQSISIELSQHLNPPVKLKTDNKNLNSVTEEQELLENQAMEIRNLKKQNKQLKKYTTFLQKMNQTLKQQLLYFTQKLSFHAFEQTHHNNRQQRITQIQYLKKINQMNQTKLQKQRHDSTTSKIQKQRYDSTTKQIRKDSIELSYHVIDTLKPLNNKFHNGFKLFKNNNSRPNSNIKSTPKKPRKKSIPSGKSNNKENYGEFSASNKKKHKMSIS